ncbi:hypothetical protein HH214_03750 [Mucilaginibacter robiniae]|uniref:Uncharacterized protein n=1 Tax=Mucilaginibacter robiniae TaxID=2728022 RepID=A0A7L5DVF3_9SPHI|nr:hypothetical protein [Mucilaginibacter robiniae]QJD95052.1 hypothetical protein HH214_03750 [Mucilaginibacter robiniae]
MKRKFEDAAKTFFKKYLTGGIKRYTFALRFGSETVSTLKEGEKGKWDLEAEAAEGELECQGFS